jgi:hypothetical protein
MMLSHACDTYEQLAEWHQRRGEARLRDGFLALAAAAALDASRHADAERLRQRLLQLSPYHLLRPYPSFAAALQSPDVNDYLADLRRQYPPERAAQILEEVRGHSGASTADLAAPPLATETLVGSSGHALPTPTPAPRKAPRRSAPSPYEERVPVSFAPPRPEGPALTWVPGLLFLIVFFIGCAWAAYALIGPFLD